MKGNYKNLAFSLLAFTTGSLIMLASMAQSTGEKDPERWHAEDSTPQEKYLTSKREAGAALQESLAECKKMTVSAQAECMKEARARFQADMTEAKDQLAR